MPDDYIGFVRETFQLLEKDGEYTFRSKLSNMRGNTYIIEEIMRSYHFLQENITVIIHSFNSAQLLQQNYDQIIKSTQEIIKFNQFKDIYNQIVKQYDKQYARAPGRLLGSTRTSKKQKSDQNKICRYRYI